MADRFTVEQVGRYWRVTDAETGDTFLHLTEESARLAAQPHIVTGIVPVGQENPDG